jgi:uncharacterized protein
MAQATNDGDPLQALWDKARMAAQGGDFAGTLYVWKALADKGVWQIYSRIGWLYERGAEGVQTNPDQAVQWYRKALFEADDPIANLGLGRMYYKGVGVRQNHEQAKIHFEKALALGESEAALFLGFMAYAGIGTVRDVEVARSRLEEAAAAGYCYAYLPLGRMALLRGRLLRALMLWMKAWRLARQIAREDKSDPRLSGLDLHRYT